MVGGVSLSIRRFAVQMEKTGHRVLIVAPMFDGQAEEEENVVRIAALKNFNKSKFSVPLPFHLDLGPAMKEFDPDIIHAHHPFFLGDTALRLAAMTSEAFRCGSGVSKIYDCVPFWGVRRVCLRATDSEIVMDSGSGRRTHRF